MNVNKIFNGIIGVILGSMGVFVIIYPLIFDDLYGLTANTSEARSTLRAVIGGTEVVLGAAFLKPTLFGITDNILNRLGCAIFGGIFVVRVGHLGVSCG